MADDRHETPEHTGEPVPRDLPDQQANEGEDPWEVPVEPADDTGEADDVPDTDEAGTGRKGAPQSGAVHPEHPAPEEPSG
ncbi:hypothetical protein ACM01_01020 [Streptomyces viridochromogenes]|uniref:Uncharacterized protein n=1 Tax=Streptomyces viridochromogenes TaxID=1938 RepID=A0A0J7ZMR9_STRVR|nr:hypothetical protein [Streptomyces viridochromogenes]KMS77249.1 hypothetical protein ACM01_01020 [Streptomyces viridochromogenes]KOG18971.1 hypothetical protein ADK36_20155 [Streptomyces viridochromogenes]KOG19210.1 hypothetical protein ADK35_20015 [Streptomyces viridochromogenes]